MSLNNDVSINAHPLYEEDDSSPITSLFESSTLSSTPGRNNIDITMPDAVTVSEHLQHVHELENFVRWLLLRPRDERQLYLGACRALVQDLERSLSDEDVPDETSTPLPAAVHHGMTDDRHMPLSHGVQQRRQPLDSPQSSPLTSRMPRAREHDARSRFSNTPASPPRMLGSSLVSPNTVPSISGRPEGLEVFRTAAVLRPAPALLPDVLYCGRTPPYWRWSDDKLPVVQPISPPLPHPAQQNFSTGSPMRALRHHRETRAGRQPQVVAQNVHANKHGNDNEQSVLLVSTSTLAMPKRMILKRIATALKAKMWKHRTC